MNVDTTPTPFPHNRIVGEATPARLLLLQRIDAIVAEGVAARSSQFTMWTLQAVLTDTRSRRARGYVVALRAEPKAGLTPDQAGPFPHELLIPIASRIVSEVWEATTVAPDVASPAPQFDLGYDDDVVGAAVLDPSWKLSA